MKITNEMIEAGLRITLSSVNLPAGECLHETDVREILSAALSALVEEKPAVKALLDRLEEETNQKFVEGLATITREEVRTLHSALVDVPAVESEPAALIEREVLAELRKHHSATGTVCSPLFKSKFGDKVPLYASPVRSAIAPARAEETWQTIETAPKDGTPIDLWGANHLHPRQTGRRATNVTWGPVRDWMGNERNDWQHGQGEDFEPTHWRPLPASPSLGHAEDGMAHGSTSDGSFTSKTWGEWEREKQSKESQ